MQEVQWEKERKAREQLMQEVERLEIPIKSSLSAEEV